MEFLKEILGDELFEQVQAKINEHNESAETKVKLADLGAGGYVSKEKFASKESELQAKVQELLEANNLIGDLKNASAGNDELQGKITEYESQIAQLQAQIQAAKLKAAIKVALMSEHATDVDYLTFKLNEKLAESGETLELDENDNIKGWKEKIEGLRIQFPTQFESSAARKIEEHRLEQPEDKTGALTRSDILKMPYQERSQFAAEHPEAYEQAMGRA